MDCLCGLGKYTGLICYIVVFSWILSDFRYWENVLLHLFAQISIGTFELIGYHIPITGKAIIENSRLILQSFGTIGILSCFAAHFKSKKALRVVSFISIVLTIVYHLPIVNHKVNNPNAEILKCFKLLAVHGSLLLISS